MMVTVQLISFCQKLLTPTPYVFLSSEPVELFLDLEKGRSAAGNEDHVFWDISLPGPGLDWKGKAMV